MRTRSGSIRELAHAAFALVLAFGCSTSASPAAPADAPAVDRVGTYDSRVVAYAWFWGGEGTRVRDDLIAVAHAAKQSGDPERTATTAAAVTAYQETNHLQVFSTAPVDELLEAIRPKLAVIMADAGVTRLVSKWDVVALDALAGAEKIDVTDALAAAFFSPTDKQRKVIAGIKRQPPLPLEKARDLVRAGKL